MAPAIVLAAAIHAAAPTPLRLSVTIRRSLLAQLRCHADFAPHKPSWDVEAWRPDVGYARTVFAECNP
jgi:hypothetical protein